MAPAVYSSPFDPVFKVAGTAWLIYALIQAVRDYRAGQFSCRNVLAMVGGLAFLVAVMLPTVARVSKYHEGKSQFEWAQILESGDASQRQAAIDALCSLWRRYPTQTMIPFIAMQAFIVADAKEALPFLRERVENVASESERERILDTIKQIEDAPKG